MRRRHLPLSFVISSQADAFAGHSFEAHARLSIDGMCRLRGGVRQIGERPRFLNSAALRSKRQL